MTLARVLYAEDGVQPHVLAAFCAPAAAFEGACDDGADPALTAALHEAYEKGLADGKRQTEETLAGAAQALGELFNRLQAEYAGAQESLKHDVLRLSLAIGRQVALCELQINRDAVAEMVARLLHEAEDRKVSVVRLNPRDAQALKGTLAEMELQKAEVALQVCEEVPPGGCVLETGFGRLDARFETRAEELAAVLLGSHRNSEGGPAK